MPAGPATFVYGTSSAGLLKGGLSQGIGPGAALPTLWSGWDPAVQSLHLKPMASLSLTQSGRSSRAGWGWHHNGFAGQSRSLGVQNEAGQRLIEFCQEKALVIANTLFQQHERLYTWTSPDGKYQNQIDYILCSQRWRSSIQLAKMRLGADCGSDHELLIAEFRLKLKKVGKTATIQV